jgi:branched-chain amino acid transport system substrate-binding protein
VLCCFNTLGTPTNTAIHKYMNQKKVPQLFVATGASKWGNPKDFPWTMGFQPDYHTEGVIYAKHILANVKDAKVGVLMQNDDYGKDYFDGFKDGLGKDAASIVKHVTYEVTDPTSTARSSSSRTPAPTSSSTSRRRSSPPRRSARRPTSAGSRCST